MELAKLVEMFVGQDGDKHDLEVSLTDIRRWHAENKHLREILEDVEAIAKSIDLTAQEKVTNVLFVAKHAYQPLQENSDE